MSRHRPQAIINLPAAQELDLDEEQLTSYLSDVFAVSKQVSIRVKDAPQSSYRGVTRLGELHVQALHKRISSAELVYDYLGNQCVDTLVIGPSSTHLTRKRVPVDLTA